MVSGFPREHDSGSYEAVSGTGKLFLPTYSLVSKEVSNKVGRKGNRFHLLMGEEELLVTVLQ